MILPSTFRFEWDGREPCANAVSGGSGRPVGRLSACGYSVGFGLDAAAPRPAREIEGGHQFEIDAACLLRIQDLTDALVGELGVERPVAGLRLTWVFDRPPGPRPLPLRLELPAGARLDYQGTLAGWEIDEGCRRPAGVVGSFAIRDRRGAKIGHVYRPILRDARGATAWADLASRRGGLEVRLPDDWLGSAERRWPVILDPTLGYTSVGGTAHSIGADYLFCHGTYTTGENGSATSMSVYGKYASNCKLGVYADSGGTVAGSALLRDTTEDTTAAGEQWNDFTLTSSLGLSNGTPYWLGDIHESGYCNRYYDTTGGSPKDEYSYSTTYSSGSMPDPAPDPMSGSASRQYSIYVTYTPAGGGGAVPAIQRSYRQRRVS